MVSALYQQFKMYPIPILVFIIIMEAMVDNISLNLEDVGNRLRDVERGTDFGNHDRPGFIREKDKITDYKNLVQNLGSQTSRFVLMKGLLDNIALLKDFILDELFIYRSDSGAFPSELKRRSDHLIDRTRITASTLEHLKTYGAIEGRLQAQQNVVSLITL